MIIVENELEELKSVALILMSTSEWEISWSFLPLAGFKLGRPCKQETGSAICAKDKERDGRQ